MKFKTIVVLIIASLSASVWASDAPTPPTDGIMRKFSKVDTVIDGAVRAASRTRASDPIKFLSRDMKSVVGDLSEYQTGQPVQVKEQKVVSQLDELIAQLEKECKSGKPGSALNPSKPMPD